MMPNFCRNLVEMKFYQICPGAYKKRSQEAFSESQGMIGGPCYDCHLFDISKSEFRSIMVLLYTTPQKFGTEFKQFCACDVVESTEDSR